MPLDGTPIRRIKRRPAGKKPATKKAGRINEKDFIPPVLDVPHLGDHRAPIVIVLDPVVSARSFEFPIKSEDMQWLAPRIMEFAKLGREDIQFIAAAPSITFEQNGKDKEVTAHLKAHEAAFDAAILALKPKLIVPMGARACRQIIGKAVQITKVRGAVIEETAKFGKIPVLPLMSPFYARRHPENEALFCADLETFGRVVSSGYQSINVSAREDMTIEWCFDIKHLLRNPPDLLSVDIEGVGLVPFAPSTRLLTVQLTHETGKAVVIPIDYDAGINRHHRFIDWIKVCHDQGLSKLDILTKRRRVPTTQKEAHGVYRAHILSQLKKLLENPKVRCIGQGLKFDVQHLWYQTGIDIANYYGDTLLLSHVYDENMLTRNIDDLARIFTPEYAGYNDLLNRDPEHQGKSRMDLLTPDKMLRYAGGDTIVAFDLYNRLYELVGRSKSLLNYYHQVVMRGIRGFAIMERVGFPIKRSKLKAYEKYLAAHQEQEKKWLLDQLPRAIKDKHKDTGVGLKPDRAAILIDYLYEHPAGLRLTPKAFTKTGQPSVSAKMALPYYAADYEWVRRFMEYTKNQKLLSTYIRGFYKHIHDGFVRSSYHLHKTDTGRSSSSDPNGQNYPKRGAGAKKFREAFVAPKGWHFLSCDLSQAELRIAAMISGDERMMQVYLDGGDIHRATAAGVMGLTLDEFLKLDPVVQALKRYQAKAVNFGFLYGMWWKKFKEYAKTDYGVDYTDEEAANTREMFFETYPRLGEWHQKTEQFVRKNKYVRSFIGRVRHLPMVDSPDDSIAKQAVRQAINSPVQSFGSDIGVMAIGLITSYLKNTGLDKHIKVAGFIHDAIVFLVRDRYSAQAIRIARKFMENVPFKKWFGWEPTVPIIADAEIGKNLAETYELKPRHYVRGGPNKTYWQIRNAVLREELPGAIAKATSAKNGKDRAAFEKAVSAVHDLQRKLKEEPTNFGVFAPGRVSKNRLRRPVATPTDDKANRVAFKVRKPYPAAKPTERQNAERKTPQRTVRKIRRIPKAA